MLQKINGEAVRVNDFYNIGGFNSRPEVHNAMSRLEEVLGIKYQYLSGLIPGSIVLCPIEPIDREYSDARGKILLPEEGTRSLLSSINELYIEGRGWMERDSFFKEFRGKNYFLDPTRPIVDTIKVNFKNLQNGECGQRDILPCVLRELWKQPRSMNSNRKLRLQKNYH